MANDIESLLRQMDAGERFAVLPALKILVDHQVFSRLVRANVNQLVDNRTDLSDEDAVVKEVRETRQNNRILLGLEESARQIVEGMLHE